MMDRKTLTVPEAARLLGISKNSAYDAANRGDLPVIRICKRFLVPKSALENLLGVKLEPDGKGAA